MLVNFCHASASWHPEKIFGIYSIDEDNLFISTGCQLALA